MRKQIKTKSADDFFRRKFKDRGFSKAYDEVGPLMDISVTIAEARNKAGISQADMAKQLHTTQSVISRIENGNQNLSVMMLAKIAQLLNCDLMVHLKPHKMAA